MAQAQEGQGQGEDSFLWENSQPWETLSNSDNSGGRSNRKARKKPMESTTNSPTGPAPSPMPEKRSRGGGGSKSSSSRGGGSGDVANNKGGGGDSDHEIHIWTERERRKKMRNMFSSLHELLPQLPSKADKSTIVDEAVNYIKTLQQTLQKLQKEKLERTQGAPMAAATCFDEAPSSMAAMALQTTQTTMVESRESFLADQGKNWTAISSSPTALSIPRFPQCFQTWSSPNVVLNVTGEDAHINVCTGKKPGILSTIFYVMEKHKIDVVSAHVSSDYFRSMYMIHARASAVSDQFPEALMFEEIFKLAVGEMLLWLS